MIQSAGRFLALPKPGGSDPNEDVCTERGLGVSLNAEWWTLLSAWLAPLRHPRATLKRGKPWRRCLCLGGT